MLWQGREALIATLKLISAAELASSIEDSSRRPFIWRQSILRAAANPKQVPCWAQALLTSPIALSHASNQAGRGSGDPMSMASESNSITYRLNAASGHTGASRRSCSSFQSSLWQDSEGAPSPECAGEEVHGAAAKFAGSGCLHHDGESPDSRASTSDDAWP